MYVNLVIQQHFKSRRVLCINKSPLIGHLMPSYWPQLLRIKGYSYRKQICISAPPLVSPELGVISAEARVRILESHEPHLGGQDHLNHAMKL